MLVVTATDRDNYSNEALPGHNISCDLQEHVNHIVGGKGISCRLPNGSSHQEKNTSITDSKNWLTYSK